MKSREQITVNVLKEVQACQSMGEALTVLTDCVAAMVYSQYDTKSMRLLIMAGCIKRLKEFKKQMQNEPKR